MLKACWNYFFGDRTRVEGPYGSTYLRGTTSRALLRPQQQLNNEKMFLLPKVLSSNDKVTIQGVTFYERRRLTISLVTGYSSPDYSNIACQLDIFFNGPDKIAVQVVDNGNVELINEDNLASDFIPDPQFFDINFHMRSPEVVTIGVGESYLESIQLKHDVNNIRFITVHGDVEKVTRLDFNFG